MIRRLAVAGFLIAAVTAPAAAQTTVESRSPTLAELLQNVYGPHGLTVDSEAVLPDGSTHSAHFNGAFQSEFGRINIALVRQLGALPIPSPASGFTYAFDSSTGTFVRSTQSFGPILADRAETIGRGRFAFGYSLQQFTFETFDGLSLSHIPAVFTHDDFALGGGRADVITTTNAISASVSQSAFSLTYGATEHFDISFAVPLVRTSLSVVSDALIHRIGTADNPAIHFFRDPEAPGTYGSERSFIAQGSAAGIGDVIVRGKATAFKTARTGVALGLEARFPTGQEENLLGSGSFGLKAFEAVSATYGRVAPHVNVGYQWNGRSVLAGDVATGVKGDLPDELSYVIGADVGVEKRLSIAFDVLGRYSADAPRLLSSTFTPAGSQETFQDIAFSVGSLNVVTGSFGMKANVAGTMLVTFNLQFKLNDAGVRAKVAPLIGIEYGFYDQPSRDTFLEDTMPADLQQTMALLTRTPAVLDTLLRDLPDAWTRRNEGDATWNAFDIVGHLIHAERTDWMPRVQMVLQSGETRAFDPFDREGAQRESQTSSLAQRLDEFARLRSENMGELRSLNLKPEDLERRGRHPALGVVTLSQLLATWATHDLTHLHQLSRVMAHQYREAVGPWSGYLGVLQCAGHSS